MLHLVLMFYMLFACWLHCGFLFRSPGIYYFETEASYVSNTTHLCLVKVTNSLRQHKIEILDEGFDHVLLSVIEGDCVWWNWNKRKVT